MALYIKLEEKEGTPFHETHHRPYPNLRTTRIWNVVGITADGDELSDIFHRYSTQVDGGGTHGWVTTIPFPFHNGNRIGGAVSWYGSIAQFIVANLI